MAEICRGLGEEKETSPAGETSKSTRRRRIEMRRIKVVCTTLPSSKQENREKRQRSFEPKTSSVFRDCEYEGKFIVQSNIHKMEILSENNVLAAPTASWSLKYGAAKYGMTSVCGRRRNMEDTVSIHPSFCSLRNHEDETLSDFHYFGVYDGHGCSHVAMKCRHRLHELVKEELEVKEGENYGENLYWKNSMGRSFMRMEEEVIALNKSMVGASCRCELHSPECDSVGSTAVVSVVTPQQIIVANCGDSRAVLCRNGQAVPLSNDHKPDHPDELSRIQAAGGRVVYWDGPRVQGILAMSRAIGDNYLKPYVICDPDVTVMERTEADDCLILASDGLWNVVSNDTACSIARMCLTGKMPGVALGSSSLETDGNVCDNLDKACSDASMLLTKLALTRRSADNVSVVVIDLRKDT